MYTTLLPLHHYLAYAVLLLVALFTFYSLWGWLSGRDSTACDKKLGLAALIAPHNAALAARMDRILRLEDGVLVAG